MTDFDWIQHTVCSFLVCVQKGKHFSAAYFSGVWRGTKKAIACRTIPLDMYKI